MERANLGEDESFIRARELGLNTIRVKGYSGINLDITRGSTHALVGEHKCGKTELLLTLAGRMLASEGTLQIADKPVSGIRDLAHVRKIAGLALFEHVNEVEAVLRVRTIMSAELSLKGKKSNREATEAYLSRFGLADIADATIEELPAFALDSLGIALGMAGEPEILCVEDIERDLTEHQSIQLIKGLKGLSRDYGTTIICGVCDYDLAARFDSATCMTKDALAQRAAFERKHIKEVA